MRTVTNSFTLRARNHMKMSQINHLYNDTLAAGTFNASLLQKGFSREIAKFAHSGRRGDYIQTIVPVAGSSPRLIVWRAFDRKRLHALRDVSPLLVAIYHSLVAAGSAVRPVSCRHPSKLQKKHYAHHPRTKMTRTISFDAKSSQFHKASPSELLSCWGPHTTNGKPHLRSIPNQFMQS